MFPDGIFTPAYGPIDNIMLTHHLFCFQLKATPFIKSLVLLVKDSVSDFNKYRKTPI